MIEHIEWLGHASFRIVGAPHTPLIYIDPWRVARGEQPADVILVSHDHYDHCSPADIAKLRGPETVILAGAAAAAEIEGAISLRPWQVYNLGRVSITAVPAYNAAHPRTTENLGFVIAANYHDIYYAGDTGLIAEMARLQPDIALLPISGAHTMTIDEALEAARRLRPRYVLPSHWGGGAEGASNLDARLFAERVVAACAQP